MKYNLKTGVLAAALGALAMASAAWAGSTPEELISASQQTLDTFKQQDPELGQHLAKVAAYAVFPTIGKGAFIVGGSGGDGVLFEKGKPVGKLSASNISVGLQAGGQTYSQLVLVADEATLARFKKGKASLSGSASAVAVNAGASARAKFVDGIAVLITSEKGVMGELAIGGQKFKYEPFAKAAPGT